MPDLLLISDLHLGSHLKPRLRGETVHLASRIEYTFPRFLAHYRQKGHWQLVINGDFIDFWNIELPHVDATGERLAILRVHAVFDAHPGVETALAQFLRAGHGIVFVTGNHDAELLYPGVRAAIAGRLEAAAGTTDDGVSRTGTVRLDELPPGRVRFVRWFLREEGGAWIEHGHKFDPSCATPAALAPTRGGNLVQTVAEVATRKFCNVMPEIDYDAPDRFSGVDYVRWALARGWRFVIRVMLLYLKMVGQILALWAGPGRVDKHGQQSHQQRLAKVAENAGLQMSALAALEKMAPPPSAMTVAGIFKVTMLDRFLASATGFLCAAGLMAMIGAPAPVSVAVSATVAVAVLVVMFRKRQRRDVARDMLEVAASVGQVTGVPLVLMGHSHRGTLERLGSVLYGNSGSWLDGSHLVVRRAPATGKLVQVELRCWRNGGTLLVSQAEVPTQPSEASATAVSGAQNPSFDAVPN